MLDLLHATTVIEHQGSGAGEIDVRRAGVVELHYPAAFDDRQTAAIEINRIENHIAAVGEDAAAGIAEGADGRGGESSGYVDDGVNVVSEGVAHMNEAAAFHGHIAFVDHAGEADGQRAIDVGRRVDVERAVVAGRA